MRGASKSNDNLVRYGLIGVVVLILLIVTIIIISGDFGGGGGNASPTPTPTGTTDCLHPSNVGLRTALMAPHVTVRKGNPLIVKRRLVKIERAYARHRSNFVVVSRSALHYIAAQPRGYVLGTIGKPSKAATVLNVPATDLAFNTQGNHILYTTTAAGTKYSCASVVLYAMALNGTNKRLLLATRFPLLNGGSSAQPGTLAADELNNGWILLVGSSGRLYAFNPTQHLLGPIQKGSLGKSYLNSGSASQRLVQVTVSPNGKYLTETNASAVGFVIKSLKTGAVVQSIASGTPEAWSFLGNKLAYIQHQTKSGQPSEVIATISLPKGTTHVVKTNQKKYGSMTLNHVMWARSGRWIGFTGTATTCSTSGGCRVYAFIGTPKGKRVHKVGASK